jgi:hypothetical protein
MENEIRYTYKKIDQRQLESKLDELWQQIQEDGGLAAEARGEGIDLSNLRLCSRRDVIVVSKEGDGLDPVTTALVVAFAPVAARVARDLWAKIFLPRILRDKGQDALIPKK